MEPTTERGKQKKSKKTDLLRSIDKQSAESVESVLKKRKRNTLRILLVRLKGSVYVNSE